jgi:hypothetical protein
MDQLSLCKVVVDTRNFGWCRIAFTIVERMLLAECGKCPMNIASRDILKRLAKSQERIQLLPARLWGRETWGTKH